VNIADPDTAKLHIELSNVAAKFTVLKEVLEILKKQHAYLEEQNERNGAAMRRIEEDRRRHESARASARSAQ